MPLALRPPVPPMLAKLERELPRDGAHVYEPKWDGFRCLAFRDGAAVELQSRHGKPLARYFPEIVEALLALPVEPFALDGELLVVARGELDFNALLGRIHPAASRVAELRAVTPAAFVAFDVLATDEDVTGAPFEERRRVLERILEGAEPPLFLTPATDDPDVAAAWLDLRGGVDGVVAKRRDLRYEPGARRMTKVKRERTADCVVAGFRVYADRPELSSLLLGLYDDGGELRHVGVATSFTRARRAELLALLAPLVVPLEGHPWEHGFLLGGGSTGRLLGAAGSWRPGMTQDWTPVAPVTVVEVAYDQVDDHRLRHAARLRRLRPDREATSCRLDQLDADPADVSRLLA